MTKCSFPRQKLLFACIFHSVEGRYNVFCGQGFTPRNYEYFEPNGILLVPDFGRPKLGLFAPPPPQGSRVPPWEEILALHAAVKMDGATCSFGCFCFKSPQVLFQKLPRLGILQGLGDQDNSSALTQEIG